MRFAWGRMILNRPFRDGLGKFKILKTMTEFIVKRTGKLLFPHLPRELRRHHLSRLVLVFWTIVFGNATLILCMMHGWR